MKKLTIFLLTSTFIFVGCSGGGGGSSPLVNPGPTTPTYTYKKVDERLSEGTASSFTEVGRSLIYTYSSDGGGWASTDADNFNINFSQGTDSYGDTFFTIEINQNEPRDSFTYALNYQFSFRGNDVFELYDAPQFSNISEYFSNADLQAYGLSNPDTYAGVEYVDMIIWNMNYDNGEDDYVAFAYGDKTNSGDMPSTGSATYNVKTMGFWNNNGNQYNFHGDGQLIANFASMSISGNLLNDYVTDSRFSWSQLVGYSAGGMSLTGDISGSSFSGDLTWANDLGTGSFEGNFFGPNAKEIGGTFWAAETDNFYYNNIIGSFVGTQ